MKLLIAVINKRDDRRLRDALIEGGLRFTEISSTGGFLREGNVTMLIGVEEKDVETALSLIREHCRPREEAVNVAPPDTRLYASPVGEPVTIQVGGAQVFVLDVERVVRI
jgi:uncharacterized protein YaaQ